MDRSDPTQHLNQKQAARYLGITPRALQIMERAGRGPVCVPSTPGQGRQVLYSIAALDSFVAKRRKRPASPVARDSDPTDRAFSKRFAELLPDPVNATREQFAEAVRRSILETPGLVECFIEIIAKAGRK
jgi:hypothetical protein